MSKFGFLKKFKGSSNNKNSNINFKIENDNCNGEECRKCVTACPNNVLIVENNQTSVGNPLGCKSCRVCASICPNDCIIFKDSF